ncbi:secreted RxLR effector protein 161-like [Monomorium pharaonis]|uniref:secreted RxLR effector protein 161-like n=1 Tax=Monomorium pharaonis TaxID=307658 RepID=UPI0017467DB0|nr:secreted RxLR effector protein 161-like [Monomorium pharaonis]
MYLAVSTRPDIAHAVSKLSQFNNCHTKIHWGAAKRVLRYLKGTNDVGLVYSVSSDPPEMYTDADWGSCGIDRKSYTGYTFIMSGASVSWESKKQRTVALSSTEAEYMALSDATKEALYVSKLLDELGTTLNGIVIKNDSNGVQKLAMNPVHHARSKHIDIRHHFVRDAVSRNLVTIQHVSTDEMATDILTKGLPRGRHENYMKLLGLTSIH